MVCRGTRSNSVYALVWWRVGVNEQGYVWFRVESVSVHVGEFVPVVPVSTWLVLCSNMGTETISLWEFYEDGFGIT